MAQLTADPVLDPGDIGAGFQDQLRGVPLSGPEAQERVSSRSGRVVQPEELLPDK